MFLRTVIPKYNKYHLDIVNIWHIDCVINYRHKYTDSMHKFRNIKYNNISGVYIKIYSKK
jgi:hypothetical protein